VFEWWHGHHGADRGHIGGGLGIRLDRAVRERRRLTRIGGLRRNGWKFWFPPVTRK